MSGDASESFSKALGELLGQDGGPSTQQVMELYDNFAKEVKKPMAKHSGILQTQSNNVNYFMQYDSALSGLAYAGPKKAASKLAALAMPEEERKTLRVLDLAAGTGLVGEELRKRGFQNLEALGKKCGLL